MRFGLLPLADAEGAVLGHSVRAGAHLLKKGRKLSAEDIEILKKSGIKAVMAARLETGDVSEDLAARRLAEAARGRNVSLGQAFTGRCNLYADANGIALVDAAAVDAVNALHESLTIATLMPFAVVEKSDMVATVKVIPLAAPQEALEKAEALARTAQGLVSVKPFVPKRVLLLSTVLPGLKPGLLDKTREAVAARLSACGSTLMSEHRIPHEVSALTQALRDAPPADLLLVAGASATVDRRDVVPAALAAAGGRIVHFGMPVDPGNLLLVGTLGPRPVIGLPGCARSPKINGFDFVLQRMLADLPVTGAVLAQMGAGGLLKEIPSRPQPRNARSAQTRARRPRIAALILAAGRSVRMGRNKLLADLDGKPLVRWVAEHVRASAAEPVIAVTGHESAAVDAALKGLDLSIVHNARFAEGLSTSLKAGLDALADKDIDGVVVCLGDMPRVTAAHIDRLMAAFDPAEGRAICVPVYEGKRGNPVLWGAQFIPDMKSIEGDAGAKALLGTYAEAVCEVEMSDIGVLTDVDTPEALAALAAEGP